MKRVLFGLWFFVFSLPAAAQTLPDVKTTLPSTATVSTNAPVDIEFILDASGSMDALVDGVPQIDIAKKSLKETVASIPSSTAVALRVYAHRIPKTDKEKSCQDTELLIPFQTGNASQVSSAIDGIQPKGYTPIAYSLKASAQDFRGKESQSVIILLSDGEETCGGDPVAEAKNLLAQGFKVTVHTIGFRVDDNTRKQLQAISTATGGVYYDARDAASLTQNLKQVTQKALFIDKPAEAGRGQEIRGGSQYGDAVAIQPGTEYRLDHHQKQTQYDYFSFPVKRGQVVKAIVATQEKGVALGADNQGQETDNPYAGVRLVDGAFKEVGSAEVIGSKHGKQERVFVPLQDQTLYLLVGSGYNNMHKDSPFKVEISDHFDAGSGQDAGEDILHAQGLTPGQYDQNWLLSNEDMDFYKFPVKAGESYTITLSPQNMDPYIRVEIFDPNRTKIAQMGAPNEGAIVRVSGVKLAEDGDISFSASAFSVSEPAPYAISIKKDGDAAPVEAAAPTPQATPTVASEPAKTTPAAVSTESASEVSPVEVNTLKRKVWTLYGVIALSWIVLIGLVYLVVKLWLKARRLAK